MTDSSNNLSIQKSSPDDLVWFAFQYLSDELSDAESEAFEELLAQNQEAREASATATQLVSGLKSFSSPPTVTPTITENYTTFKTISSSATRYKQWSLVSCAAMILLATTFLLTRPISHELTNSQISQTEPSQADLEHVLDLWAESADETNTTISAFHSGNDSIDVIDQQNILAENQPLEIPDWLYTAVSLPEESVN